MQNKQSNMQINQSWWDSWFPVWEFVEDRHLSIAVTDSFIKQIESPVLIIGAGQGLIVKHLRDNGLSVTGIDINKKMIEYAKSRRNVEIILADAANLPFDDKSFNTVILASGVLDYIEDNDTIQKIFSEAKRVNMLGGNIFAAFYKISDRIERIYKTLGVIDSENNYRMKRIFEMEDLTQKNPITAIFEIQKWTNKSLFYLIPYWTLLGLTLPKKFKEEQKKKIAMENALREMGLNPASLKEDIPDKIPYKTEDQIRELFNKMNQSLFTVMHYDDCYIFKFHNSILFESNYQRNIPHSNNWLIKVTNLSKKYKGANAYAVDKINLQIEKGIIFGLLGPNGAGKTTTISMISHLLKADSGVIEFNDPIDKNNIKNLLGLIPQEIAILQQMTAKENLLFFGGLYSIPKSVLKNRVNYLLDVVGLLDRKNDIVKNFSSGMKRRLNFAIGLINNPQIIFLDEPTVGIDPQSRNYIFDLVLKLKEEGKTIIYTTHYMEEANKLCNVIAIMDRGKIILEGQPKELITHYGLTRIRYTILDELPISLIQEIQSIPSIMAINQINNIVTISVKSTIAKREIIDKIDNIAKKHSIKIKLNNIESASLETLFLDITGKDLRDY